MFLIGVAPSTLPSFSATPDSDSVSGVVQPLPYRPCRHSVTGSDILKNYSTIASLKSVNRTHAGYARRHFAPSAIASS